MFSTSVETVINRPNGTETEPKIHNSVPISTNYSNDFYEIHFVRALSIVTQLLFFDDRVQVLYRNIRAVQVISFFVENVPSTCLQSAFVFGKLQK